MDECTEQRILIDSGQGVIELVLPSDEKVMETEGVVVNTTEVEVSPAVAMYSNGGNIEITADTTHSDHSDYAKNNETNEIKSSSNKSPSNTVLDQIVSVWLKNAVDMDPPPNNEQIVQQSRNFAESLGMNSFTVTDEWINNIKKNVLEENKEDENKTEIVLQEVTPVRKSKRIAEAKEAGQLSVICKVENRSGEADEAQALSEETAEGEEDCEICPITGLRLYGDDEDLLAYMNQEHGDVQLNQAERKSICLFMKRVPKCTDKQIVAQMRKNFGRVITKTQGEEIRSSMAKWMGLPANQNVIKQFELEELLAEWIRKIQRTCKSLIDEAVIVKAKKIGKSLDLKSFSYSMQWLKKFKKEYDISQYSTKRQIVVKKEWDSDEEYTPKIERKTYKRRKAFTSPREKSTRRRITEIPEYPDEYKVPKEDYSDEDFETKGWLTLQQKKELCNFNKEYPEVPQKEIRKIFSYRFKRIIPKTTLTGILKDPEKWLKFDSKLDKCKKGPKYPELEKALFVWIYGGLQQGCKFTNKMVYDKAKVIGCKLNIHDIDWNYSEYWMTGFKKRYHLEDLCNFKKRTELMTAVEEIFKKVSEEGDVKKGANPDSSAEEEKPSVIDLSSLDLDEELVEFKPEETPTGKRMQIWLSPAEKQQICRFHEETGCTVKRLQVYCKETFGKIVGKTTMKDLRNEADKWLYLENPSTEVVRHGKYPLLEDLLARWVREITQDGSEMPTVHNIIQKAKQLAPGLGVGPNDLKFSPDWVIGFKRRAGFPIEPRPQRRKRKGRESDEIGQQIIVDSEVIEAVLSADPAVKRVKVEVRESESNETTQPVASSSNPAALDENIQYWHCKLKEKLPESEAWGEVTDYSGTRVQGTIKFLNTNRSLLKTEKFIYKMKADDLIVARLVSSLSDYTCWNDALISLGMGHCNLELYHCDGGSEYVIRTQQQWENALEVNREKDQIEVLVKLVRSQGQWKYSASAASKTTVSAEAAKLPPQMQANHTTPVKHDTTTTITATNSEALHALVEQLTPQVKEEEQPEQTEAAAELSHALTKSTSIFQCGQCFTYIQVPESMDQNSALAYIYAEHCQSCPGNQPE